ncbi:Cdc6/Cdc18 family protein [Haloprofundus salinisoli]|uniref:Cdc6/Cdc18 family protein n=1 Tax=Haloprofundus salinisoli TaxID=2876193 RepID=UPI001CCE9D61|nr:ORC1-type DNA replication protein [Haloprofundus salinisoli]
MTEDDSHSDDGEPADTASEQRRRAGDEETSNTRSDTPSDRTPPDQTSEGRSADPAADGSTETGDAADESELSTARRSGAPNPSRALSDVALDDDGDDSRGLFDDLLSGEPIFENKEVLRPSYTPHELPHRTDQINQMATILVSALRGETPSNILIYGKTGTGKTASAKFVSQELERTSQKYDVPCEVEYINCEVTDTQYRVLAQLANKFIEKNHAVIDDRLRSLETLAGRAREDENALADTGFDAVGDVDARISELERDREEMESVPMTGWPTDRVYSTFFDAVDYNERVVVIMLDEIDKLVEKSGDDTLYNLSRMNSELDNSRISIMGISNDLKFTDFLDPRVKSSLGEEEIVFPPYDANQLRDILQHRADVAFKSHVLSEHVIPLCAAFAAQEHGDARRALDLLRTAGELAERSQADGVAETHVRQAQDKIELDRVVEVVRTLPTQSKIVLFSIILLEKNGVHNINTGEVFNIYKRLCEELDADILTQRRVTDLISELDMLGIVNAVVVSKGRYGRTKEISLSVPIDETEAVLLSDSRLGDIENAQPFVQARFDN